LESLSLNNALLLLLAQFAIYFPSGYLLLSGKIKAAPFVIKLPIFVSVGLVTDTIILSLLGLVYIGNGSLVVLGIISYGIMIFRLYSLRLHNDEIFRIGQLYNRLRSSRPQFLDFTRKLDPLKSFQTVVPAVLFMLVFLHFAIVAGYIGWPPGVDAINHGLLTSLLIHTHRLQTSLAPIAPSQPWFEPFAVHVMTASISLQFGIFPGEALLMLASAVMILILVLIYSITFMLTRSSAFSTLALVSGFYIYPVTSETRFLEKWLIGFYYNTPYPNLLGYLVLLVFVATWFVIFSDYGRKQNMAKMSQWISLFGIGISYTPFIILPSVYVVISYLSRSSIWKYFRSITIFIGKKQNDLLPETSRRKVIMIAITAGISSIVIMVLLTAYFSDDTKTRGFFKLLDRIHANSYYYTGVILRPDFFTNLTGIWTLVTWGAAILSLIRRNRSNLTVLFLLFSSVIIASSTWGMIINDYVWFLLHGRLFTFLMILDWIMISTYLSDLVRWLIHRLQLKNQGNKYLYHNSLWRTLRAIISLTLIITLFMPSLLSHATLEQADRWDWIFGSSHFRNDYNLLAWASHNINMSDLIMIDYTYTSRSIHSFSLKNTTHTQFPHTEAEIERDKNNAIAWNRPTLLRSFIDRYNVKYIFLDSESSHRLPPEVAGDDKYSPRVFDAQHYREILDRMPFLKLVKQFGAAAIYQVTS
jgi:hypothetical protein